MTNVSIVKIRAGRRCRVRLTQCCSVVGVAAESTAEHVEEACEICDLRLLGLPIAGECRVTEIDIAGGKVGSRSRVGSRSGSLIGGGHPAVEDWCDDVLVDNMGMQDIYIIILIAASFDKILIKRMREKGVFEKEVVLQIWTRKEASSRLLLRLSSRENEASTTESLCTYASKCQAYLTSLPLLISVYNQPWIGG